jgi:hypothetical protein
MRDWREIEAAIEATRPDAPALLAASEAVLENWIEGRGATPTKRTREGFRLLALHRQGAMNEPSFNACRETCREIAYHYNLLEGPAENAASSRDLVMMGLLAKHLMLFVRGKMEVAGLGAFCCAARPVRAMDETSQNFETRG